jgi:hypothetical protein
MPTYPKGLASSQDPQTLSLTVSSATQVLLYLVAFYAVHKGLDPATATNQVQAIIDLLVNAAPLVMVIYHSVQTVWGLARKLFSFFKTPSAPAQQ